MLKILLVDDEVSVLNGVAHILNNKAPNYEVVRKVHSAAEALQVMKLFPVDVVITDVRMPEMNGIELTEVINQTYPDTSVIILSGHADFEYVRQAMKKGAFDYLLKPCRYQVILELLTKIEERRKNREIQMKRSHHKTLIVSAIKDKGSSLEQWTDSNRISMVVFAMRDHLETIIEQSLLHFIEGWNMDLHTVDMLSVDSYYLVLFHQPPGDLLSKMHQLLQTVSKNGYTLYIAVNEFSPGPKSLSVSYQKCVRILEFLKFNENATVMDSQIYEVKITEQKKVSVTDYISGKSIGRYILNADQKNLQKYVDSGIKDLKKLSVYMDPVRLKKELISELSYLEHEYIDKRIGLYDELQHSYMEDIQGLSSFREMLEWLKQYLYMTMMFIRDKEQKPHYIQAAIQFIERYYMEDVTLKSVSEAVFLNPWYFSTQFKKYMNVSFSDYLNQIRIRVAKEFLKQKDLKVYQVAEMVGYQDAAYFSTVFKNMENVSPKEYQKFYCNSK